ncbi:MAG TPA: hypothetical protein VLA00_15825 [Xanthobacteraceae bacterium]|nr:hypothetical protein [Xanthobacteraceae bacterium]
MHENEVARLGAEVRVQCANVLGFHDLIDCGIANDEVRKLEWHAQFTSNAVCLAANIIKLMDLIKGRDE